MSVEDRLSGFAPAEPPDRLRERVLALAAKPAAPVWRGWWPVAAAAAVLVVAVIVNLRVEAGLTARVSDPARPRTLRTDQPYGPGARLPVTADSWAQLRRTPNKETS